MVTKTTRLLLISSLLLIGFASLTVADDIVSRYDYDKCARRCADKPAHERQVCVAACSRRHRPDHGRAGDPRREIEECRRRCETEETGERCQRRCEELYGDKGWERDMMINTNRDLEDRFEQECEKRCVMEFGQERQLQCHERCVEQKPCLQSCQTEQGQHGDQERCQRTCMQQVEEQGKNKNVESIRNCNPKKMTCICFEVLNMLSMDLLHFKELV